MRTLWIVSGGSEAVPGIKRAKNMGLHIVVSDINPDAPGFAFADDKIIVSTYDAEATSRTARQYHTKVRPINGVICVASDVPLTVATVAEALGLPGISVETAKLVSDKLKMKDRFKESGLPIPWFCQVEDVKHLNALIKERGYPLILKPVDSRGARGVLRLTEDINLDWAFHFSESESPTKRVMAEEFLAGPQISTESILIKGEGFTPGFTDRNYEFLDRFKPYIIENGGQQPSILSKKNQEKISMLTEEAGLSLGVYDGVVKGDMVMTSEGPKIIEVATRLSGGWFSTDQIPLATGVDFLGAAIKIAIGDNVSPKDVIPKFQVGVAIRYFFPIPGRVLDIKNTEQVKDQPWIHRLEYFIEPGKIVEPVTNHTKRAGFVITNGKDRKQAVERAELVCRTIEIQTTPL